MLFHINADPSEAEPLNPDGKMPTRQDAQDAVKVIQEAYKLERKTFVYGTPIPEPDGPGEGRGNNVGQFWKRAALGHVLHRACWQELFCKIRALQMVLSVNAIYTQEVFGNKSSNCMHIFYTKELFPNECNNFGPHSKVTQEETI